MVLESHENEKLDLKVLLRNLVGSQKVSYFVVDAAQFMFQKLVQISNDC